MSNNLNFNKIKICPLIQKDSNILSKQEMKPSDLADSKYLAAFNVKIFNMKSVENQETGMCKMCFFDKSYMCRKTNEINT